MSVGLHSVQEPEPEMVLEVEDLYTEIYLRRRVVHAVDGVSLSIRAGETLGIVGESGCGKSMTAMSIMQLLPPGGHITGGSVRLGGVDLLSLPESEMRKRRGSDIGMIFQDPLTSLNPTMTIGAQIAEAVHLHRDVSRAKAMDRAVEVLDMVGIAQARKRIEDYPHQFSGGMRQRVVIAIALACEPRLLIADEPTTALDVTIQAQILDLIERLRRELGMAVMLVTHDLGVIAGHADRVSVVYAGRVVENAGTDDLFARPQHRYTQALFNAMPERAGDSGESLLNIPGLPPDLSLPQTGCRFAARCQFAQSDCRASYPPLEEVAGSRSPGHRFACFHPVGKTAPIELVRTRFAERNNVEPVTLLQVEHLEKDFPITHGVLQRKIGAVSAVADVSFGVSRGRTFGLVGESGCGKTTTGRLLCGLDLPTNGVVRVEGADVARWKGKEGRRRRRSVQFMFQDSYASLDPRMRIGSILREPLEIQGIGNRRSQEKTVRELLGSVGLPYGARERYAHELSGGQRQRVGLARALALEPSLIVADEPVSALDVSVQAQILNLMRELQNTRDVTYVLISHDLGVVRYLSDTIGVMYLGKLVEIGPADDVYLHPAHPYTHGLIEAIPGVDPSRERQAVPVLGELPSAANPPSGCRFRTRCPFAQEICALEEPVLEPTGTAGHRVACHFPLKTGGPSPIRYRRT
ncbi:ABC transporter ATP-binding protein [Leekyejoonella antrihumi]|uniref:ABC transporter ATP-binding protein n=1 Tax=Leekyejoonella antrihumi TaxID=1660198 RepID=A0A563E630_9MICO|nr:ABC transporter ATP-binding protein [Leekyejoonella antrihumi]TWP37651.1 ABC transporter ATP-binding protein [Leekyejoonella antrihumi]